MNRPLGVFSDVHLKSEKSWVLGPGSWKSLYEKALCLELAEQRIPFEWQKEWTVRSRIFFSSFASIRVHLRQKRRYRV